MGKLSHHRSSYCLFKSSVLQHYRRVLQHRGESLCLSVFFLTFERRFKAAGQFAVDPGAFSFNLKIFHNLLIGNVPLRSSFAHFQQRITNPTSQTRNENSSSITNPGITEIASPISNDYPDLRKYKHWFLFYKLSN